MAGKRVKHCSTQRPNKSEVGGVLRFSATFSKLQTSCLSQQSCGQRIKNSDLKTFTTFRKDLRLFCIGKLEDPVEARNRTSLPQF